MKASVTQEQVARALEQKRAGKTFTRIACGLGVSRQTLHAAIKRETMEAKERSRTRPGFHIQPGHIAGCLCREDEIPFVVPGGMDFALSDGRGMANPPPGGWYLFRCNDPACDALLHVEVGVLAGFLGDGLAVSTTKGEGDMPGAGR